MNAIVHAIIVAGVIAFAAALSVVEFLRLPTDNPVQQPISAYITGRCGWLTTAGFLCLTAAVGLLAYTVPGPFWTWHVALFAAAVALIGVVATKWEQLNYSTGSALYRELEAAHLLSAAIAFGGVTLAEFHSTIGVRWEWAPASAVIAAVAFTLLKRSETSVLEKAYTALIIVWFGCLL